MLALLSMPPRMKMRCPFTYFTLQPKLLPAILSFRETRTDDAQEMFYNDGGGGDAVLPPMTTHTTSVTQAKTNTTTADFLPDSKRATRKHVA